MRRIKTLIVIDNLHTGGVATSLYNYLYFTRELLDISLLVFNEETIDYTKIPKEVLILRPSKCLHILGKNHSEIKQESLIMTILRLIMILIARVINGVFSRNFLWPFVDRIKEYELAIAYAQDDSYHAISKGCIDFIVKKVTAKHRSAMVHCDYRHFGGYAPKQAKMFSKLDSIICVSESCRYSFIDCFPALANKTFACENFTNKEEIIRLAGTGMSYPKGLVNFVSVCRLSRVKGLSRAIKAFGELYRGGYNNFLWTIVGGGTEYDNLKKLIVEENLTGRILLVGNKDNPYFYIKNASCFLLPSFHEAAPMVFTEAAYLGVPVLTTNTCSAKELVERRSIGIVVDNNYEGIKDGLKKILTNPYELSSILSGYMEGNQNAAVQLTEFINSIK